jgi:hypothetical protein
MKTLSRSLGLLCSVVDPYSWAVQVAGHRLYKAYPKQFQKILDVVMTAYLPALRKTGDADVAPVINRIETYVGTRSYEQPPQGRNMPVSDESSALGA